MADKVKQKNEMINVWKKVPVDSVSIIPENGENVSFIKVGTVWQLNNEDKTIQYKYDYEIKESYFSVTRLYEFYFFSRL